MLIDYLRKPADFVTPLKTSRGSGDRQVKLRGLMTPDYYRIQNCANGFCRLVFVTTSYGNRSMLFGAK